MSLVTSIFVAVLAGLIIVGVGYPHWTTWAAFWLGVAVCAIVNAVMIAEKKFDVPL